MVKILIVDDEIDVCDFVKAFFEERNFRVYTALNGDEALRIVKKEKPHIILLDIRMKGMDGIETLQKIRDINKKVRVIMVTAVEDRDRVDVAFHLGASEYITKPLVLESLEAAVTAQAREVKNV